MNSRTKSASGKGDQTEFPLLTVLALMGIITLVAAVGLFATITNLRSQTTTTTVASAPLETNSAPNSAPNKETQSPEAERTAKTTPSIQNEENSTSVAPIIEPNGIQDSPEVATKSIVQPKPEVETTGTQPEMTSKPPAKSDTPACIDPHDTAKLKGQLGLTATIEGVVQKEGESGSGKTFYLWFSNDRQDAMVFMLKSKVEDGLSLEYLASFRGKRVRVTGTVEEQFGTKRLGIKIRNKNQIEIVR